MPGKEEVEGGLRFSSRAEEAWINGGGRLASTLNYALVRASAANDVGTSQEIYCSSAYQIITAGL